MAGRDGSSMPVIHLMAEEFYSKRPLGCQSDCWLTPTIDVRPLADFSSFSSVHLATAQDGRPQVVAHDGTPGTHHLYYLDLTQGAVSYYYAPSASSGQAVAQRINDVLGETSRVYYLHYDGAGNLTEVTGANQSILGRARACPELAEGIMRWARC